MTSLQKAGAVAAFYIAVAYLAAIPYFLLVVDYPSVVDPVRKLELLRDHRTSMHAMHLVVYEGVGLALMLLGVALHDRMKDGVPTLARLAAVVGLVWACLLLASSMVFNYGMAMAVDLYASDPAHAVWVWQAIEIIAQGVGGAGGELLGAVWVLLVTVGGWRTGGLPPAVNVVGATVGVAGLISNLPSLRNAGVVFGLLQIVWFIGVGTAMLRRGARVAA